MKDWHLVVFVLAVNSFNAFVIFVYLIQEGVAIGFNATFQPNVERFSSIDGVSLPTDSSHNELASLSIIRIMYITHALTRSLHTG